MSSTEFKIADLEETLRRHLSKYTGTIITDDLIRLLHAGADLGEHVKQTLQQELQECLHKDIGLLPSADEVRRFIAQVDAFKYEVVAIEQRIESLEQGEQR